MSTCYTIEKAEYRALKAENEKLRKERDHWHVEQVHAYGNWEDAHKRVIELEAENAKLRDDLETQREVATHNTNRNAREYKRVCDENDKLREALRAAWKCAHTGTSCSDCRLIAGGCTLQTAMCELGIEVE